jgi:hypothetical protein
MTTLLNTNLEVIRDSVTLHCLPLKDCIYTLYKGDRVVVAEVLHDSISHPDSLNIKVAHSQEIQGWISHSQLLQEYVPTDSISQAIYLFSQTHLSLFLLISALFIGLWGLRRMRKKESHMVYFNDIDTPYPMWLCLLMALGATVYASIQAYTPALWESYYYHPTLSPLEVPFPISLFLCCLWSIPVLLIATIDEVSRRLHPMEAMTYLLGLASACIFSYIFFTLTVPLYIGYPVFFLLFTFTIYRTCTRFIAYRYRCGECGEPLRRKGHCPKCGAMNQ